MAHHQQVLSAFDEEYTRIAAQGSYSISSSGSNEGSIEEREFKERHGEQYHLRHHLSGCAQSLYNIDFSHDFSRDAAAPREATAVLSSQEPGVYEASFVRSRIDSSLSQAELAELEVTAAQHSALSHSVNGTPLAGQTLPLEAVAQEAAPEENRIRNKSLTTPLNAEDETLGAGVDTVSALTSPQITDFDDSTMGGWELNASLEQEQVLENGQLHLTGGMMQAGTPILQQSLSFKEGQSYQLDMNVQFSEGDTPPQFEVVINNQATPMVLLKQGEGYILRAEFVATSDMPVTMAIVPSLAVPASQSVWLDNIILQPTPHDNQQGDMSNSVIAEPIFDFAELALEASILQPAVTGPMLGWESLLIDTGLHLYIEDAAPQEVTPEITLEALLGNVSAEGWNITPEMAVDFASSAMAEFIPVVDLSSLEITQSTH